MTDKTETQQQESNEQQKQHQESPHREQDTTPTPSTAPAAEKDSASKQEQLDTKESTSTSTTEKPATTNDYAADDKKKTMPVPQAPAGFAPGFQAKHPAIKKMQHKGIMSPTDNMMSPCSQKIEQKRKHLLQTIKPKSLTDKFSAVAAEEKKSPLAATSGEDTLPPGSPMKM